jgi:hypothetical protein
MNRFGTNRAGRPAGQPSPPIAPHHAGDLPQAANHFITDDADEHPPPLTTTYRRWRAAARRIRFIPAEAGPFYMGQNQGAPGAAGISRESRRTEQRLAAGLEPDIHLSDFAVAIERLYCGPRHPRGSSAMTPVPIKLSDLMIAFELASSGYPAAAYLALDTGKTHLVRDWIDEEDPPPADLEESDRYLALPERSELGLGRRVALDFMEEVAPDDFALVRQFFSRRGAFARFKGYLAGRGLLDQWSEYEAAAEERALRQWCKANEVPLIDDQQDAEKP